jgi:mannitol/fructose-specific phosphotransferase system IIA component (Ntr-type)
MMGLTRREDQSISPLGSNHPLHPRRHKTCGPARIDLGHAVKDILSREAKMTTGIGHGIAVPHARTRAASKLRVIFARHHRGIDWGAVDGKPVHFIVLLVSPPDQPGPHLQFLAAVARLLQDEAIQAKLMEVKTAKGILDTLCPPHRRMTL